MPLKKNPQENNPAKQISPEWYTGMIFFFSGIYIYELWGVCGFGVVFFFFFYFETVVNQSDYLTFSF